MDEILQIEQLINKGEITDEFLDKKLKDLNNN